MKCHKQLFDHFREYNGNEVYYIVKNHVDTIGFNQWQPLKELLLYNITHKITEFVFIKE